MTNNLENGKNCTSSPAVGDFGGRLVNDESISSGWYADLLLTSPQKLTFARWKASKENPEATWLPPPLVDSITRDFLPNTLSPNTLALMGFLFLGQAWYLQHNLVEIMSPRETNILVLLSVSIFFVINSVVNAHAMRIQQKTSLSVLLQRSFDVASMVWLVGLTCTCLGGATTSVATMWYAVQAVQLLCLWFATCLQTNMTNTMSVIALALITVQVTNSDKYWTHLWSSVVNDVEVADVTRWTYCALLTLNLVQGPGTSPLQSTLFSRFVFGATLLGHASRSLLLQTTDASISDVVVHGLLTSVVTSDLWLSQMAQRPLHILVMLSSLIAVMPAWMMLVATAVYYAAVWTDLSRYMNLPLLSPFRNVYCDGVYDLCHIGHKRAFQNALRYGDRLLVGVMGDADSANYKRPPVMTCAERCREVEACKGVTQAIPNGPCFGMTHEFLRKHNIHVLCYGIEYKERYPDPKDDPYYRIPREMGIAIPIPRTNELSTSELMERCKERLEPKN